MAAVLPTDLAQAMMYGPQTQQAIRKSAYLADALKQLNETGGQNIKGGWGELGAKLLASAILNRQTDKAQSATLTALKADQSDETARSLAALGYQPPAATAAPSAAIALPQSQPAPTPHVPPQPQTAPTPAPAATAPTPPQGPTLASAPTIPASPQDRSALAHMIAVEAGGEGPDGMAAAAHVAVNRLKNGYGGAKSLTDVIYQPHQFEGITRGHQVGPQELAQAQQVADAVLSGQSQDPTGGAMAFLNPDLQVKLGRHIPNWAQGQGQRIGNHVFFGGKPGATQNGSAPPPPPPNGPDVQNVPQPYQVASNGQTPPPPSAPVPSPPVAGTAPAASSPQAAAGATSGQQWPTWKPSSDELHYVQGLLVDPRTHAMGVQEALKMRQKMTEPVEATVQMINGVPFYVAKDPTSGAPVAAIAIPKEALTKHLGPAEAGAPGAPSGTSFDVKPTGERSVAYQPPPGFQAGANGALQYQPGGPADPTRPQPAPQGYRYAGPGGQEAIPGSSADPRAPMNLISGTQSVQKELRPLVDLAVVAKQSYGAVQTGFQQQNGAGDIAMVNGLQHLIDKGVVRGEDVNMQMKSNGLTGSIGSLSQYLSSGGLLTPEIRQKVLSTATNLYKNVDQTYRAQVMGYRQTVDEAYGHGSFDKLVMPAETVAQLGWDQPAGNGAPGAPQPAPAQPHLTPGTLDAATAEARRRGLIH